jgi:hypothetical protein
MGEGGNAMIRQIFETFLTLEILRTLIKYTKDEAGRQNIPEAFESELMAYIGLYIYTDDKDDFQQPLQIDAKLFSEN